MRAWYMKGVGRSPHSLSHRTFRWNDGEDTGGYDAVETRDEGLLWYTWSHAADGGRRVEAVQSWDDFRRDGPPRECPPAIAAELRALAAEKAG